MDNWQTLPWRWTTLHKLRNTCGDYQYYSKNFKLCLIYKFLKVVIYGRNHAKHSFISPIQVIIALLGWSPELFCWSCRIIRPTNGCSRTLIGPEEYCDNPNNNNSYYQMEFLKRTQLNRSLEIAQTNYKRPVLMWRFPYFERNGWMAPVQFNSVLMNNPRYLAVLIATW